ncbi:MAG: hypothetical protein E6I38_06350, partial [Chloroflexi bacterium]
MTTEQLNTSHDNLRRLTIPVQPVPKQKPAERVHNWDEAFLGYSVETAIIEAERCIPCCAPATGGGRWLCRGGEVPRDEQPARHVRPPLPAGIALRGRVRRRLRDPSGAVRQAAARGDRQARGVHRRLRAPKWRSRDSADGAFDWTPGRDHRLRTGRAGGRRGADQTRACVHGVRIVARPRRHPPLWHPELQDAQGDSSGQARVPRAHGDRVHLQHELMRERGYDAVFLGTGAPVGGEMKIEGEELANVYQATEFLVRGNLEPEQLPENMRQPMDCANKDVLVVGGGDTSMDCVRTAIRLDAKSVTCMYRRTEAEQKGREEERKHAREEGVEFMYLTIPTRFTGENGRVTAAECEHMRLGE